MILRDLREAESLRLVPTGRISIVVVLVSYPIPPEITFTSVIEPLLTIALMIAPFASAFVLLTMMSGGPS